MQHDFYSFTKILNYKDWSKSIAIIYLYSIFKYFSNGGGGVSIVPKLGDGSVNAGPLS